MSMKDETAYRHEWKHILGASDMIAIRQRLRAVANVDANAVDGKYLIRSLYFDNLSDQALREKLDGDLEWMLSSGRPLVQELYVKMTSRGLKPRNKKRGSNCIYPKKKLPIFAIFPSKYIFPIS